MRTSKLARFYVNLQLFVAEIRAMFLENLLHGHEAIRGLLKEGEAEHFDKFTSELETTPAGHIKTSSVVHLLKKSHNKKVEVIDAAAPFLETLVLAHAQFPFAQSVALTKDLLLQAVILLTWRCHDYFRQRTAINKDDTICKRPETERLGYMFSALACPPTGRQTRKDVLDVVSRINYPMGRWAKPKDEPMRKLVKELEPLAERLQPKNDANEPEDIKVADLHNLVELVASFPSRWEEPLSDVGFGEVEVLSKQQFVQWAERVRILKRQYS